MLKNPSFCTFLTSHILEFLICLKIVCTCAFRNIKPQHQIHQISCDMSHVGGGGGGFGGEGGGGVITFSQGVHLGWRSAYDGSDDTRLRLHVSWKMLRMIRGWDFMYLGRWFRWYAVETDVSGKTVSMIRGWDFMCLGRCFGWYAVETSSIWEDGFDDVMMMMMMMMMLGLRVCLHVPRGC